MYFRIFSTFIALLLLSGCVAKTPATFNDIKTSKHESSRKNIDIYTSKDDYLAYIDRSDKIKFLCHIGDESIHRYENGICNYYDSKKHSYENLFVSEEVFSFSKTGYNPLESPRHLKCGVGSTYGWLTVLGIDKMKIKDYTSKDRSGCRYRFTKIDETMIPERIVNGAFTFMTSFITAGNLHIREFDREAFIDAIDNSNIDSYKNEIYKAVDGLSIDGGFDMIYLNSGSYASDLRNKYDDLLQDKSKKAGVIFLDNNTRELLSIVVFNKHKSSSITKSISFQIQDTINYLIQADSKRLETKDIKKYIPSEIALPKLPDIPKLVKSEYETRLEFNAKVENSVSKREMTIRDLQREYSLKVLNRNNYIDNLEASYIKYINNISFNKQTNIDELKNNIPLLTKILFLENISGYSAEKFQYNAESKQLFFTISSTHGGYSQKVVAIMPPSSAKNIKKYASYKIIPDIAYKDTRLELKGFEILDSADNESYKLSYTDINFTPEIISIDIVAKKESIDPKIATTFTYAKQQDQAIVDTTNQEIWYIDIANSLNARVPQWFLEPKRTEEILAYGEGNTLINAKHQARSELAMLIQVNISTSLNTHEIVTNFKHSFEVKSDSLESSNVKLHVNDYTVYKQEQIDGKWYVALKYEH